MNRSLLLLIAAAFAAPAVAQTGTPVVAIPPLATPDGTPDAVRSIAWQATQLIATDLQTVSEVMALPPDQSDFYSYPEVTAPTFSRWRAKGAKALLTGFVQAKSDGRVAIGCYVYDIDKGREVGRTGFVADADDWRRAAHKCSGLIYKAATGAPNGPFDARIAYVAKSGIGPARTSRIALMDSDGYNHSYVTAGDSLVLTPRLSPHGDRLVFVSYASGKPSLRIADSGSGNQRPLIPGDPVGFAPHFSPDGSRIAFTMTVAGNSDIYVVGSNGGVPQRLTSAPGIDTDPSFSHDGSQILFESDRSGLQQLYVMKADGSNQQRVTFGGGAHAASEWSPDGSHIAFVRRGPDGLRIGIMDADGRNEQVLTTGPKDESPTWAPSGRELLFQRTDALGRTSINRISIAGGQARKVAIPQDGADPDWSGNRE